MRWGIVVIAVVAVMLEAASAQGATPAPSPSPTPNPTPTTDTPPGYQCFKRKLKALGDHAACRTRAQHAHRKSFGATDLEAAAARCEARVSEVFATTEAHNGAYCAQLGDAPLAAGLGESFALLADRVARHGWLVRTYVTGGSYVSDYTTGLDWAVKTTDVGTATNYADPHDVDNVYTWSTGGPPYLPDGTVFTDFLARLNGALDGVCFAGHCDWRLPTKEELATIVDANGACAGSCIDPVFGPTRAYGYWSSTTDTVDPQIVWIGDFSNGGVISMFDKLNSFSVRAVRGGAPL